MAKANPDDKPIESDKFCPKCGKDTTSLIGCLRYNDPKSLEGDDADAAYRLQRIFAGMEPPRSLGGV